MARLADQRRGAACILWLGAWLAAAGLGAALPAGAEPAAGEALERPAVFGWPIALQPALSATFGETRSGGLHAGIDVKTWGRRGYLVRALADGHVVRVRTSPWGYGRVVYQPLTDGRTMVFAHLDRFAPAIAVRVEAAQQEAQTYSVDLWFQTGEMPVARGDTLAWTGASGVGPPHLHLELRDADNQPINPLLHGFAVADATPPTLQAVGLIPMGAASLVDGGHEPVVLSLRWDAASGTFQAARAPVFSGRVGVALLAYDLADGATNKLAPLRLELRVDGSPIFHSAFTRFSYSHTHQISLDRTYLPHSGGSVPFFNLYVRPGNRLGLYETGDSRGLLSYVAQGASAQLAPGPHALELRAADASGNRSVAQVRVVADQAPQVLYARSVGKGAWEMELQDADDAELAVLVERGADGRTWKQVQRLRHAPGPFRWEGGSTPAAAAAGPSSAAPTAKAQPWLRFTVEDAAGARAFAVVHAPAGAAATIDAPAVEGEPLRVRRRVHADFVELIIAAHAPLAAVPEVRAGERRVPARQTGASEYRATVPLSGRGPTFLLVHVSGRTADGRPVAARVPLSQRAVRPGEEQTLVFADGEARLHFASEAAYEEVFPQWEWFVAQPARPLRPVSSGHAFGPQGVSFGKRIAVELAYPPDTQRLRQLGMYAADDRGRWSFVGGEVDTTAGVVRAQVGQLRRFAVLRDEEPPRITALQPASGARIQQQRPLLSARITDRGAGIGREQDIRMELDGKLVIAEYDPDERQVLHQLRTALAPGMHELVVTVRDMAGNEAAAAARFWVE